MPDTGLTAVLQSLEATVSAGEASAAARLLQGLAQHLKQQTRNPSYNSQLQRVGSSCCNGMVAMLADVEVPVSWKKRCAALSLRDCHNKYCLSDAPPEAASRQVQVQIEGCGLLSVLGQQCATCAEGQQVSAVPRPPCLSKPAKV